MHYALRTHYKAQHAMTTQPKGQTTLLVGANTEETNRHEAISCGTLIRALVLLGKSILQQLKFQCYRQTQKPMFQLQKMIRNEAHG